MQYYSQYLHRTKTKELKKKKKISQHRKLQRLTTYIEIDDLCWTPLITIIQLSHGGQL